MTGGGARKSWLTFKLPTWLAALIVVFVVSLCVAVIASPELAANLAELLARWLQLPPARP
jgi:hypothetical protein